MQNIRFTSVPQGWTNNSLAVIGWTNASSVVVGWTAYSEYSAIKTADFVRITTPTNVYRFATTANALTIPEVDGQPFSGLGTLVSITDIQRDIKSTANETSVTLVGLDTAVLGVILAQQIKGCLVEMWHGFFDANNQLITNGGTGGLYKFFTGYINSFQISEQWMTEIREYVGLVNITASSIQVILQNRSAGRYTNNNSWQFFTPNDTSMNRVPVIQNINYYFGKVVV